MSNASSHGTGARTRVRELMLQALYQMQIAGHSSRELLSQFHEQVAYERVDQEYFDEQLPAIIKARKPGVGDELAEEVVGFIQALRGQDLFKAPGVAETLDWVSALNELNAIALDPAIVNDTLGVLLKYQDDIARMEGSEAKRLVEQIQSDIRLRAAE